MGFFLLILYLVFAYFQPGEYFPELAPYRIMLGLGIVALVASLPAISRSERPVFRAAQIYLMLAFAGAMMLSLVQTGWFGGGTFALGRFSPSLIVFLLIVLNVTSLRRLRIVAVTLVLITLCIALQGVLAYHVGWQSDRFVLGQRLSIDSTTRSLEDETEEERRLAEESGLTILRRIRSIGFLNDPNDLAQALLIALPFLWLAWRRGRWFRNAFLVWVPTLFFLYGIYLTHSRGGMVGLLVLVLLVARDRLNRTRAVILTAVLAAVLLSIGFTGGRSLSIQEESAHGRLDAWADGLAMLRSSPLLGIGYANFWDIHGLTAHNSFVLCFAEVGLIGYFFWLGLLLVTIFELRSVKYLSQKDELDRDFIRWSRAIVVSLYTYLIAAWFLSRTYQVLLYLLLAFGIVLIDIARRAGKPVFSLPLPAWLFRIASAELGSLVVVYLLMKLRFV